MKLLIFFLLFFVNSSLAAAQIFKPVFGPIELASPHGAHREYGTEWWYFTGHLQSRDGSEFGFELTFFRVGLRPKQLSNWEAQSIIISHFAITDEKNNLFLFSENRERESFGQAGADDKTLNVWSKDWRAKIENNDIFLSAKDLDKSLQLKLSPKKPLVLQGDRGFSKKGDSSGEASIYTSFTRLEGDGEISIGDSRIVITKASAWMDHEFFTSKESKGAKGWDWFALQLSNGEEIMLYQLRDSSGHVTKFSSGMLVRADGSTILLKEFKIENLNTWQSPKTGTIYPSSWRILVMDYDLIVSPTLLNQEIIGSNTTGVNYWEGRSKVTGTHSGQGYVELVGY